MNLRVGGITYREGQGFTLQQLRGFEQQAMGRAFDCTRQGDRDSAASYRRLAARLGARIEALTRRYETREQAENE